MEYSKDQIPILDILIKRNENVIWMDHYHKPTDTQPCQLFTSSYPNHFKQNIPFCLEPRICTVAENNDEKLKHLKNSKSNLSKYHYPDSLIKQGFQKALSIPQKIKIITLAVFILSNQYKVSVNHPISKNF